MRVVAVAGSRIYAGAGGIVHVIDAVSGMILEQARTGNETVEAIAIERDTLVVLTGRSLRLYRADTPSDGLLGAVRVAGHVAPLEFGRKLFVGGGFAYVGYFTGYTIVDVRDRAAPRIVGLPPRTQAAVHDLAANGSGWLVMISSFAGPQSLMVSLYDVSNPTDVTRFITSFRTPGVPRAVSLFNGLAYVADSQGLQVVSYLQPDTHRQAPSIALRATFPLDPAVADENFEAIVMADIADDVQVRTVEFYLDGGLAFSDGSYPFEFRFTTPAISASRSEFRLRVRALDTGGNSTWSPGYEVRLSPDSTPPRVRRSHPAHQAILGSVTSLTALMSERLDPASVGPGSVRLSEAGPDWVFGTGDDIEVPVARVEYTDETMTLTAAFADPLPPGRYRVEIGPGLADLAGNFMSEAFRSSFWAIPGEDLDQDGVPDHLEPAMGLDPTKADTNGNGLLDGEEDFDRDGIPNAVEILLGFDPTQADTGSTGIHDGEKDRDADGLSDIDEFWLGTSPVLRDTDGDGWWDEAEVTAGSDPLDPASRPAMGTAARPSVELVRPERGDSGGLGRGTVAAVPRVELVLPHLGDSGDLGRSTVMALPRVELVLPHPGEKGGLPPNTTIARPLLRLEPR
ncbi:MAG: Ig-like domain-containing protein [Verrucomicrobiae bacterium]|nr:Ig-like domain-containing protein [Verrucomicrobiae bacterium]